MQRGNGACAIGTILLLILSVNSVVARPTSLRAVEQFSKWAERFVQAAPADREAVEEGIILARERRVALKSLIQSDPELALQQSLQQQLRRELPESVNELLEKPIAGKGEFVVIANLPLPGREKSVPSVFRTVTIDDRTFQAYVYGNRLGMISSPDSWLEGIALDDVIALREADPERDDPPPSPATEGIKGLLLIRVDFSDVSGEPFSISEGQSAMADLNQFFVDSSYNRAGVHLVGSGTAITPTFRMPQPSSAYSNLFTGGYALLRQDAMNAAQAAGYILTNYDYDVTCFNSFPGWDVCGRGYVGAPGAWVSCPSTRVFAHELGHNFGLLHANFWDTGNQSVIGPGNSIEYGDIFDTMGLNGGGIYHFNTRYKALLNWLRTDEYLQVNSSGTYRIMAHDLDGTGLRALKVARNVNTNYWIEFRQLFTSNPWSMNGAGIRWAGNGNEATLLLDMTPGSAAFNENSALLIGRTFSDFSAGIHITPIGKGGTIPESLDVVVNLGTFPGNVAPSVTIVPATTNATTGEPITLQASATDPNGDPLAYYWEFGDGTFGTTSSSMQTHTWFDNGSYTVTCIVSDMKGRMHTNNSTVFVGEPPVILQQPVRQTSYLGGSATFSVIADPDSSSYQWRKNASSIADATGSSFTLSNISSNDVGEYSVQVTWGLGSIISSNASLVLGQLQTFSNSSVISIPVNVATANPYPSIINVSGITQTVIGLTATMSNVTHTYPSDLDVLLVSPNGEAVYLISDAGGGGSITNLSFSIDDEAERALEPFEVLTSRQFRPTDLPEFETSPSPAPPRPYRTNLLALAASNLNGPWLLYVSDDWTPVDGGSIGGWHLNFIVASNVPPFITAQPSAVSALSGETATFNVAAYGSPTLNFQWRKAGSNIPGATHSTLTIPNVQTSHAGIYSVRVSNDYGSAVSSDAALNVTQVVPLADALDGTGLNWTTGGNAPWYGQTAGSLDFSDSAISGNIEHLQESWLQTTVTGPGTLTFHWKISSEACCDSLRFYLNDFQMDRIAGEVGWQSRNMYIGLGPHTLRWQYSKDSSLDHGSDRAWLDLVSFTAGGTSPIITMQPASFNVVQGEAAVFSVAASGTSPMHFQWRKSGVNIPEATNSTLLINNAQLSDAGNYSAVVANNYGSTNTLEAILVVSPFVFFDDFEPDVNWPLWAGFGGEVIATNYGGSTSGSNSLWFNGSSSRFASTSPVNVAGGGVVRFSLHLAFGSAFPWETLDLPEEGVVLEYSLNGSTWVNTATYLNNDYYFWSVIQTPIPTAACTSSTRFRLRQINHSGDDFDHWAIDDIAVISSPLRFVSSTFASGTFSFSLSGPAEHSCVLEVSSDLVHWSAMSTRVLTNGILTVNESTGSELSARFYRARLTD